MCMFCAAMPTVVTMGVVANARQRTAEREAQARGVAVRRPRVRPAPITAGVMVLLLIGSVVYHTRVLV